MLRSAMERRRDEPIKSRSVTCYQEMQSSKQKLTSRAIRNTRHCKPQQAHFEFGSPSAETVAIAGTFNEWRPSVTPMIALGEGRWAKDLMLPPGSYEYCLVVDGRWLPDPRVPETSPNHHGGVNSVCRIGDDG